MNENNLNKIIANNIIRYLDRTNTTQEELAEHMKVSQATVSNWCRGIKLPRMDRIDGICDFFSISRSQLMNTEAPGEAAAIIISKDEEEFILNYRQLSDDRKADINMMVNLYLSQASK